MEIIELTEENIAEYLPQCLTLQESLVKSGEEIKEKLFIETAIDDHGYFIGLVEDGVLAGMGLISKIVHPVHITGYVNNIVVSPDFRGKGLFTTIMDELETKAKDWGCDDLALTCSRVEVQGMYEHRDYLKKDTNFYTKKID